MANKGTNPTVADIINILNQYPDKNAQVDIGNGYMSIGNGDTDSYLATKPENVLGADGNVEGEIDIHDENKKPVIDCSNPDDREPVFDENTHYPNILHQNPMTYGIPAEEPFMHDDEYTIQINNTKNEINDRYTNAYCKFLQPMTVMYPSDEEVDFEHKLPMTVQIQIANTRKNNHFIAQAIATQAQLATESILEYMIQSQAHMAEVCLNELCTIVDDDNK